MQMSITQPVATTPILRWSGRIVTALAAAFLIFDAVIKVLKLAPAVTATVQLGYPERVIVGLGVLELICLAVYLWPRTSTLGAILLTGYLGGAIVTHVRVGSELFSVIFPVLVGLMLWGGLYWREARLRTLVSLRK